MALVLVEALRSPRLTFSRNLAFSAPGPARVFMLLPRIVFGSAYADMRLVPYLIAVAAARDPLPRRDDARLAQVLAVLGLLFFVAFGIGGEYGQPGDAPPTTNRRKLAALDHVPEGRAGRELRRDAVRPVVGRCRATAIWAAW